jgi:NAD(P)-dependent dehydrogenase (short-subunit alcohol dehydrogenase family)
MSRTYVITGAASGIGLKTKELLEAEGHKVIGVDLKGSDVSADLSTPEGRKEAAKMATEHASGTVDAVIACAGLAHEIPLTVSVNYFGVTEFLEAMQPALAKSKSPRVAVTSSMASLMPNDSALTEAMCLNDNEKAAVARAQELVDQADGTGGLIYGSTKRAVSRWIRRESIKPSWAGQGIALNAVGPGVVQTPMTKDMIATEEARKQILEMVPMPLNGIMEPEDVAQLLMWLTSEVNGHMTGQTIYIDGGSDVSLRGDNIWELAK